ncbi:hypothetical protein EON65_15320, partial [archaeon]
MLTLSQSKLQALPLHIPPLDTHTSLPYLSPTLLSLPCILYIDMLDSLIDTHAPSEALVASESPEDIFCTTIEKFLKDLCGLLEESRVRGGGQGNGVGNMGSVVIVSSTGRLSSLRPRTLSLFPLVISCPPTPSLDKILDSYTSPPYQSLLTPTPPAKADLIRWLRKNNTFSPCL